MTRRIGMNSFYRTSNITWQLHVVIQNMLSKKHKNWLHLSNGVITRKLSSTPLETMDPLQWGKVRSCVCRRYKSFDYRKLLSNFHNHVPNLDKDVKETRARWISRNCWPLYDDNHIQKKLYLFFPSSFSLLIVNGSPNKSRYG